MLATVPQHRLCIKDNSEQRLPPSAPSWERFSEISVEISRTKGNYSYSNFFTIQPSELLKIGLRNSYLNIRIYFHIAKSF